MTKLPTLKTFMPKKYQGKGKEISAFNGSGTNRRNKKRPITLPKLPWE